MTFNFNEIHFCLAPRGGSSIFSFPRVKNQFKIGNRQNYLSTLTKFGFDMPALGTTDHPQEPTPACFMDISHRCPFHKQKRSYSFISKQEDISFLHFNSG